MLNNLQIVKNNYILKSSTLNKLNKLYTNIRF